MADLVASDVAAQVVIVIVPVHIVRIELGHHDSGKGAGSVRKFHSVPAVRAGRVGVRVDGAALDVPH